MADFTNANLANAQVRLQDRYSDYEMRQKRRPANEIMIQNRDVLLPDIASLRELDTSRARTVDTFIMALNSITTGSARRYNNSGSQSDVVKETLSFTTYTADFTMYRGTYRDNVFAFEEALANNLESAYIALHDAIEAGHLTWLAAQKTQSATAVTGDLVTWNSTDYVGEVANSDRERYFDYIASFLRTNKYAGVIDMIADSYIGALAREVGNQGAGNSDNLAYQLNNVNVYESIDSIDTGYLGSAYAIPKGQIGMVDTIPAENREGTGDSPMSYEGYKTNMLDPFGSGMLFAIHSWGQRADGSSNNSVVQDYQYNVEVSIDIARVHAPSSTANASPIYLTGLLV